MEKMAKKIEKVVINVGIGKLSAQPGFSDKILPSINKDIASITGQKAAERPAKKSISGFKLREGAVVGLKTTLRSKRMADFLDKMIKVVLPRVRDFHGLSTKNIDKSGNMSFGIKDHLVFPEVSAEVSKTNFGMEITIVPKNMKNSKEAVEFYKGLGIPFEKTNQKNK